MNREELVDAVGAIGEDLICEVEALRNQKKQSNWPQLAVLAACLCIVLGGVAIWASHRPIVLPPEDGSVAHADQDNGDSSGEQGDQCGVTYPGGFQAEILVNGTVYYWDSYAYEPRNAHIPGVIIYYNSINELPDGYTEHGPITAVTTEEPTEDGQMKAGFQAEGTIYTNEKTPHAVYILLTGERQGYVRFISDELESGRIMWNGSHYRISVEEDENEIVDSLPENAVRVGPLHYIGQDMIPQNDLETNCAHDTHRYVLHQRSFYYDPDDPSYIYIMEAFPAYQGYTIRYLKCPLWTEALPHS